MTEDKIQELMRQSDNDSNLPWNSLMNGFAAQLAAISAHVPEADIHAMIRLGAACRRKAFAELAASEQTELALHRIRQHSISIGKKSEIIDRLLD